MNILLIGTPQFTTPLAAMLERGAHTVTLYETEKLLAARKIRAHEILIDVENTSLKKKRVVLERARENALIFTCALNAGTTVAASWVENSERVVGFGVLPPIPEMGTIELARGLQTSDAAWERAQNFWSALGQNVVTVADSAGLVRARVVCSIINEAFSALQENIASPHDIDVAMKLGTNHPHGPFEWGNLIGLDTVLGVMEGLYSEWRQDRYRPAPLLRHYALAKKTPV